MMAAAMIFLLAGLVWVWRPGRTPAAQNVARLSPVASVERATLPAPIAASSPLPPATLAQATASPSLDPPSISGVLESADAYLIAVGSFRSEQHATAVNEKFGARELPSFVRHDSNGWHVVLIGPYASDEEARSVRKQIVALDFPDSEIRREHR
jgi:cell division septation protein DedD